MDKTELIKRVIKSAREFENERSKDSLSQSLQILSATDDLSVFDIGSLEAAEFYTLLHDWLSFHSADSELMWCIVSVLQNAVRNSNARAALTHTYHFIQPLTALLDSLISSERRSAILRIILELSYGVVVCWQEGYLTKLICLLVDVIMDEDRELIPVALGILVNICHKNKPAIFTLMTCIDKKHFIRKLLNFQKENIETSVQVCKLLMVLDHLSANVPDAEILTFVRVSFLRISKAFTCSNLILMRHIVNFFQEAKGSEHGRKVLLTYPSYQEELNKLINTLSSKEVPNNSDCVQKLLEFMHQLIELEVSDVLPIFPRLAHCVMPWVKVKGVSSTALEILSQMLYQSRNKDEIVYKSMCSCFESHIQVFVEMLHNWCAIESNVTDVQESLVSLLHLFLEVLADTQLSRIIAAAVDKEELKKLLLPLMTSSNTDGNLENFLYKETVTTLYVKVLTFVHKLSTNDKEWLFLYSDLLQKKQILKALAIALYFGSYEVKMQTLYITGTRSFSEDCLQVISKCLTDLNELFMFSTNAAVIHNQHSKSGCLQTQMDIVPSPSKPNACLNSLVEKLDDLYRKNQIQSTSLASIIELYNYKMGEMRRAEQVLQASLLAADSHRTHLSHRVAHLSAENSRLHQLLYSGQQTLETSQLELEQVRQKLSIAQETASSSHIKIKQLKQDVQSKNMIIAELNEEIFKNKQISIEYKNKFEELEQEVIKLSEEIEGKVKSINTLEQKLADHESGLQEHKNIIQKLEAQKSDLEEKLKMRDQVILEKGVLIENKKSQVQSLEQEIANQQQLIKGLEKSVKEKEKEISVQQEQLLDLERMRKVIFEITGGKKNNNF